MPRPIKTGGAAPLRANGKKALKKPNKSGRKKPDTAGRVSGDRRVTGYEAGRIKTARAQLKRQPPCDEPWADLSLSLVDRIVRFCESLVITKGLLQGEKLKLLPHQTAFIEM